MGVSHMHCLAASTHLPPQPLPPPHPHLPLQAHVIEQRALELHPARAHGGHARRKAHALAVVRLCRGRRVRCGAVERRAEPWARAEKADDRRWLCVRLQAPAPRRRPALLLAQPSKQAGGHSLLPLGTAFSPYR